MSANTTKLFKKGLTYKIHCISLANSFTFLKKGLFFTGKQLSLVIATFLKKFKLNTRTPSRHGILKVYAIYPLRLVTLIFPQDLNRQF
jgi:hypothetical protein